MSPPTPDALADLGAAVRSYREDKELSQEALGLAAGLDRTYIGGIERGERNPSYRSLLRITEALDVSLSEVVAAAERQSRDARSS